MNKLPDKFDLLVRKARECEDPTRQADYVLGALAGLKEWHFFNVGTQENPQPAEAEFENLRHLLIFSDLGRINDLFDKNGQAPSEDPLQAITLSTPDAMPWCLERGAAGCAGLLVNLGENGAVIPMGQLKAFHEEWSRRGGREASGFWIPNMTTEEEDFWQEHGL